MATWAYDPANGAWTDLKANPGPKGLVSRLVYELSKPLAVSGFTATQPHNLPFLVGLGLRRFLVPPIGLREFLGEIGQIDARAARRAARAAQKASCQVETLSLVDGYRHGYAR